MRAVVIDTAAQAIRVLQITDPHLFAEPDGSLRGVVTEESLRAVLAHVAENAWPADLVVVTGDLIQDDSEQAYINFRAHFQDFGLPVLCVPGNHDIRALMQRALDGDPFRYCGTHRQGNWLILGIDSCKRGHAGGFVAAAELERIRDTLERTAARHVLVCLHHPPLPMRSTWLDTVGLDNGAEFLALLSELGRVRGCLFGHVHQDFDQTHAGMRILGTPSTCRQFLPHSDDFALDERPPAYRRIELAPDGSIDEELIWVTAAAPLSNA